MAPKVLELVGQDARPDEGLEAHVSRPHGQVALSPEVSAGVFLDNHGSRSHSQKASPVVPTPNASLENTHTL